MSHKCSLITASVCANKLSIRVSAFWKLTSINRFACMREWKFTLNIWPPHDVLNAVAFHTPNKQNMYESIYINLTQFYCIIDNLYKTKCSYRSKLTSFLKSFISDWRWTTDLACKIWYSWLHWFETLLIGLRFHMNKKQNKFEFHKVYVMYALNLS